MKLVLETLVKNNLVVNRKKCEFGKQEVAYLGHVISGEGVAVDMEKLKAIVDWKLPSNLKELRGFSGLTGYYRKFVSHYAQIAQPLTEQLKKDAYGWTAAATVAFNKLKEAMLNPPVLIFPDFDKQFIIETDASGEGLGAVLMQDQRPIAFFSKLLGPKEQLKSIYEKELMAICLSVQKWRHYLLGRHFLVKTDQQSLCYIMQQREVESDYLKWVSKLLGFSFDIQYKPGCANRVADALSRKVGGEIELSSLLSVASINWSRLDEEIQRDALLQQIEHDLSSGVKAHAGFSLNEGKLLYKNQYVIPRNSFLVLVLLQMYHSSMVEGHFGDVKTYLRLARE